MKFYQVGFTYTSSAGKTARKITKLLQSFGFKLEFESFKSVKHSWCYEFSKVGTFSGSPGIFPAYFCIFRTKMSFVYISCFNLWVFGQKFLHLISVADDEK